MVKLFSSFGHPKNKPKLIVDLLLIALNHLFVLFGRFLWLLILSLLRLSGNPAPFEFDRQMKKMFDKSWELVSLVLSSAIQKNNLTPFFRSYAYEC